MAGLVYVLVLCGLWQSSAAFPDKRQLIVPNCGDAWTNVANPCIDNKNSQVYFPHPHDNTKFIQCTLSKDMYIVQCPQGKQYNPAVTSCTQTVSIKPPTTTFANPCTPAELAKGNMYFPYPNDVHRFIECEGVNQANVLSCPSSLVWGQSRLSCVYSAASGTQPSAATTVSPDSKCKDKVIPKEGLYFSHPTPSKFIQCTPGNIGVVLNCPQGTVWNEALTQCVSPFVTPTPVY